MNILAETEINERRLALKDSIQRAYQKMNDREYFVMLFLKLLPFLLYGVAYFALHWLEYYWLSISLMGIEPRSER